ncbi:MAG: hypothetical protein P4L34_12135 [Paludibacter sp.]|nr:hypothetical protein [Paludibacter sp.]
MKKLRNVVTIFLLSMILVGMTSCEVSRRSDEGRHRGWFHKHDDHRDNKGAVLIIGSGDRDHRDHNDDN